ncbi:MAG TPA: CBS domain-containing protein [Chloroflexota bacterium]
MLSTLERFRVRAGDGTEAHLRDVAVDLSSGDYPVVTNLVFHVRAQRHVLSWDTVTRLDFARRRIVVESLSATDDLPASRVLLRRDVIDALILDLPERHSVRANDLWLEYQDHRLTLRAADIGAWAVLRRLGRGVLGTESHRRLLDWHDVEFLRGDPEAARAGGDYHRRVRSLQPSEIANLLDAVPYLHAAELLELLDEDVAADTLEVMRPERQVQVFEELVTDRRIALLRLMAPNHAADLLGRLAYDEARECLELLPSDNRDRLIDLLRYPEDSAGGIMTNDVVVVEVQLSVREARNQIRTELARPDFVYYVYVVDDLESRHLLGVLTLRDLLVADEGEPIQRVMRPSIAALDPLMSADDAARRVADQHLAALPVVSRDGRVLGAVTADAALLYLAPASTDGIAPRVFT